MSRFDYKNATVIKRVDTVQVQTADFPDILTSNNLNRVQKVTAIRNVVRDKYTGYRDVSIRFVDGVINDLIDAAKLEGRPLPETLLFEVELHMPLVEASDVPVKFKYEHRDYKQEGRDSIPPTWRNNDHIYWE